MSFLHEYEFAFWIDAWLADSFPEMDTTRLSENLSSEIEVMLLSEEYRTITERSKDDILICQVCEFRYMCNDCRIPQKNLDGEWFYKDECTYNPFISKWNHEAGFVSLADSGVPCLPSYEVDIEKLQRAFKLHGAHIDFSGQHSSQGKIDYSPKILELFIRLTVSKSCN